MSLTARVRDYAEKREVFLTEDVHKALGATTQREKQRISWALRDLVRNGTIERHGWTEYHYNKDKRQRQGRKPKLREKMWQAMTILRRFTKHDIVVTTDATFDYVNKYINQLRAEGRVQRVGTKKHGRTRVALYHVIVEE